MTNLTSAQLSDFIESYTTFSESELMSQFDAMLDECNPEVDVAGITFSPSRVLKELDPTAYQCVFNNYTDEYTELDNGDYALEIDVEAFLESWEEEEEEDDQDDDCHI